MTPETAPDSPDTPETLAPLSLAAAAAVSGVSQVTLRKHLKAGRLAATKTKAGRHGESWVIDPAALAAFIGAQYGRAIDLAGLPGRGEAPSPLQREKAESAAELRARLEDTLLELGRYRALVEASEHADARVEGILNERIAELAHERDAAQAKAEETAAELARVKSRGFFARVFGGAG